MPLTVTLKNVKNGPKLTILYGHVHSMRRMMIDAAAILCIKITNEAKTELAEFGKKHKSPDSDEEGEEKDGKMEEDEDPDEIERRAIRARHARNGATEIHKVWLLDEKDVEAQKKKKQKSKDKADPNETKRFENRACINYEGLPALKDPKNATHKWIYALELIGLQLFVAHEDNDGEYSRGEALDMYDAIEKLKPFFGEFVDSYADKETFETIVRELEDFQNLCDAAVKNSTGILFS